MPAQEPEPWTADLVRLSTSPLQPKGIYMQRVGSNALAKGQFPSQLAQQRRNRAEQPEKGSMRWKILHRGGGSVAVTTSIEVETLLKVL